MIVACGDADGWRKDLEPMLQQGLAGGMPERLCGAGAGERAELFSSFNSDQMKGWLNKMVMLAFTHMLLMAEVMGYDTAPMEGFEQDKVHEVLRLPLSYWVVALLAWGTEGRRTSSMAAGSRWAIRCLEKSLASR